MTQAKSAEQKAQDKAARDQKAADKKAADAKAKDQKAQDSGNGGGASVDQVVADVTAENQENLNAELEAEQAEKRKQAEEALAREHVREAARMDPSLDSPRNASAEQGSVENPIITTDRDLAAERQATKDAAQTTGPGGYADRRNAEMTEGAQVRLVTAGEGGPVIRREYVGKGMAGDIANQDAAWKRPMYRLFAGADQNSAARNRAPVDQNSVDVVSDDPEAVSAMPAVIVHEEANGIHVRDSRAEAAAGFAAGDIYAIPDPNPGRSG